MGWFSKKDDAKKDDGKKAPEAAAPQAAAPRPAPAPAPAPVPTPAPTPVAARPPAEPPRPQPPRPQPAAPPAMPQPAAATAPASAPPIGSIGQPDTDPTRTFAALMRVALLAPQTQRLSVQQLRTIIEPAISTGQFVVAANGQSSAAVMWATVSDAIDARARADLDKPFEIAPEEWRSGPHAWIIAVMGDAATARSLIDVIGKGPLKGAPLHARMTTPEGAPAVATFSLDQPGAA